MHFAFNNKLQIWVSLQSLNCCNTHSFNISRTICRSHFSLLYLYLFNWKLLRTIIILYLGETYNQHPMLNSFLIVTCYLHSFAHFKGDCNSTSTYYKAKLDIIIYQVTNLPNLLELNLIIASILFMNLILASFVNMC